MTEHDLEAMAREHAPFLRRLAFALVGEDAAADDLVQETWLAAARARGEDVRSPRAWLAGTTRRLAAGWRRARVARPEAPLGAEPAGPAPEPSEVAEALDAERALLAALGDLEEPFQTTVWMRYREGLAPPEIAARLGVPLETVRSRLRRGLGRLRERLDSGSGGRGRHALMLAPLVDGISFPKTAAAAAAPVALAVVMKKFAPMLLLGLLALIPIVLHFGGERDGADLDGVSATDLARIGDSGGEGAGVAAIEDLGGRRTGAARDPEQTTEHHGTETWTLTVLVEDPGTGPVPGRPVHVFDVATEIGFTPPRVARTDEGGEARFEGMRTGSFRVELTGMGGVGVEMVHAREPVARTVTMELIDAVEVSVTVRTPDGRPIAGAHVLAGRVDSRESLLPLATTGPAGRARTILSSSAEFTVSAPGYLRSHRHALDELDVVADGTRTADVVLEPAARGLAGVVVDAEGVCIADALVTVTSWRQGAGFLESMESFALTDEAGAFEMRHGFAAGALRLSVAAAGFAPLERTLNDESDWGDLAVVMHLGRDLTVLVRDEGGQPASGANVRVAVGEWASCVFDDIRVPLAFGRTDEAGRARFDALPAGALTIEASKPRVGSRRLRRSVRILPGEGRDAQPVELRLSESPRISGRVVDLRGEPVEGARVDGFTETAGGERSPPSGGDRTGPDGRFAISGLLCRGPAGLATGVWGVRVSRDVAGGSARLATVRGLVPDLDGVEIVVDPDVARSGWIHGTILTSDGAPLPGDTRVVAFQEGGDRGHADSFAQGAFELGPLAPGSYRVWVLSSRGQCRRSGVRVGGDESVDLGEIVLGSDPTLRVLPVVAPGAPPLRSTAGALGVTHPITVVSDAGARVDLVWFGGAWQGVVALSPGRWRSAPRPGSRLQVDPFEVELFAGQDRSIRVPVSLARRTPVQLVIPPGADWSTVEVEARRLGAGSGWSTRVPLRTRAQVAGSAIEIALPIGTACEIRAVTDTGLEGSARVEVEEAAERGQPVRVDLSVADRR